MSNSKLKKGDKVRVMDVGILMLQKLAPPGAKPNNEGRVFDIWDDGTIEVEFPIGDDETEYHTQCAPYHSSIVHKI